MMERLQTEYHLTFKQKNSQRYFVVIFMIAVYGKGNLADTYFYDIKQFPIASLVGGFLSATAAYALPSFQKCFETENEKRNKTFPYFKAAYHPLNDITYR